MDTHAAIKVIVSRIGTITAAALVGVLDPELIHQVEIIVTASVFFLIELVGDYRERRKAA